RRLRDLGHPAGGGFEEEVADLLLAVFAPGRDLTGIDAPFLAAGDRFDGEVAATDAEAFGDVLPCPEPNRGDADTFARSFAEDAIGDFEDGAIAAAGDEELAAGIDR